MIEFLINSFNEDVLSLEKKLNLNPCSTMKNTSTLILKHSDSLIGFLVWIENDDFAELLNIGVHPNFQRSQFGFKIILEWMSIMDSRAVRKIFCEVRASNTAAIRLYEKVGFKLNRVRRDYYDDPLEDAFEMRYDYE